jgi:putative aldouronate transport system permease protein
VVERKDDVKIKASNSRKTFLIFNFLFMTFIVFITLYPFVYLVAQSFSSDKAVAAGLVSFYPIDFTLATYQYVLKKVEFYRFYANTILYGIIGTLISVFGTAILAYPFSKTKLI